MLTPYGDPKPNPSLVDGNGKFTAPIIVYTMDGTASPHARVTADAKLNPGGGYPQELAWRLSSADPTTWAWHPVDYQPIRTLTDGRPVARNVEDAVADVTAHINAHPGKKIVLSGLSQGTFPVGTLYNEFRFGNLQSRRSDLIGVVNFGDVCRPEGYSVPLHGAFDPGGTGACDTPLQQSYGWAPTGLFADPDPFYWSFSNLGDAASGVSENSIGLISLLCSQVLYSTPQSPNALIFLYNENGIANGPVTQPLKWVAMMMNSGANVKLAKTNGTFLGTSILDTVFGYLNGSIASPSGRGNPRSANIVSIFADFGSSTIVRWLVSAIPTLAQWLPFLFPANIPFLGTPIPQTVVTSVNPHAKYSEPFAYSAMRNNTKGAVQLAFDHLISLGRSHAPATITVNPTNSKPYQLYTFGKLGDIFDGGQVSRSQNWPRIADPRLTTSDFGRKGLDTAQGGVTAALASAVNRPSSVEWVPVSYSSSIFPFRNAVDTAVDRAVSLILASPVNTKFFLAGHGIGAAVASRVRNEFRTGGRLAARGSKLLGVYNFGNPDRPENAWVGDTNPGGMGINRVRSPLGMNPGVTRTRASGPTAVETGLPADDRNLVWEFAAPNDVVAVQSSSLAGLGSQAVYRVLYDNVADPKSSYLAVSSQARYPVTNAAVPSMHSKDVVLSLLSSAALAHNSYTTFVPFRSTKRSAVMVAAEKIQALAV